MRTLFTFIALVVNLSTAEAQQGLEKIFIEKYYISDSADAQVGAGGFLPVNSTTYRIWVDMKPGYSLQAVYGVPGHPLKFETSTTFFNNEQSGEIYGNEIDPKMLSKNTVMLDSWISVGSGSAGHTAILKEKDVNFNTIVNSDSILRTEKMEAGIPIRKLDGLKAATPQRVVSVFGLDSTELKIFGNTNSSVIGQKFETENGSWASFGGAFGIDTSNYVLIAQITTDGQLSFELNLQLGTPQGGTENYVARNPNGAEFQIPTLIYPLLKNDAPEVALSIKPKKNELKINDNIVISANAFDIDGSIRKVAFFVNGELISEKYSIPYSINWKVSKEGVFKVHAVAFDNNGVTNISSVISLHAVK